jgi:hypothetical protein
MTSAEAQEFDSISMQSATQVIEAIEARKAEGQHTDCSCLPYSDVLTFERWRALGRQVCRGEKSLRIQSFKPIGDPENESQTQRRRLIPATLCVFCRCQTKPIEK